eukprot:1980924-Pyramimonas_sp.AAC.1
MSSMIVIHEAPGSRLLRAPLDPAAQQFLGRHARCRRREPEVIGSAVHAVIDQRHSHDIFWRSSWVQEEECKHSRRRFHAQSSRSVSLQMAPHSRTYTVVLDAVVAALAAE